MRRATTLLLVASGIAACANTPGAETADAQTDRQRSSATLFVERQASSAEGQPVITHVGARFVRYTGLATESLSDLIGMPHVPGSVAGCAERIDPSVDAESGRAEARLLDVGTIEVRAGDRALRLEPRRFPDLWNVVSGVIYANDSELPADAWHFSVAGSPQEHVAGFDVDARSPDDLSAITVADQPFAAGGSVALPRRGFGVRWLRGDRDDAIVVTFESTGTGAHANTIACSARDDGALDVESAWAERIAELSQAGAAITVHRVRARAITTAQAEAATVVFDVAVRGRTE